MKKIWKSLKWYFSHLNWLAVSIIFGLILVIDLGEKGHFNWTLVIGLLIFACIVPLYGIIRSKWESEDKVMRRKIKKIETIEYLSTMSHADRLELLKEVQEKTKGKQ